MQYLLYFHYNNFVFSRLVSSSVGGIGLECVRLEGSCHASSPGDRRQGGPCLSSNGDATIHLTRDPYMCERLSRVKRGYRELTATTTALEFDFTHPQVRNIQKFVDVDEKPNVFVCVRACVVCGVFDSVCVHVFMTVCCSKYCNRSSDLLICM